MRIAACISDLLYRYECVIIPGFGALLTHFQPARIDAGSAMVYPPSKTISFNERLQTNDGLLANYLAAAENIEYEAALQKLREFADYLHKELQAGITVDFKPIGTFSLNSEDRIQFEPHKNQNFHTEAFGLVPVSSTTVEREAGSTFVSEEPAPVTLPAAKKSQRPYLKYAAAAAIAIAAMGFGSHLIYDKHVENHNLAEREKANSLIQGQIQEATFVFDNPLPALTVTIPRQKGEYHLIAGAFKMEENAVKKTEELRKKGYSPVVLPPNQYGLFQVIYQSFENRNEAVNLLREIKKSENPDAWLYVKKLD